MKTQYILPMAIASLAFAANSAQASHSSQRYMHSLKVSLEVAYEGEDKYDEKDNGSYKGSYSIESEKISNKEILEALVEEGEIDEIKGWEIVLLTDGNGDVREVGIYNKKNDDYIDVTEYFGAAILTDSIYDGKYTYNSKKDVYKEDWEMRTLGGVELDIDGFVAEAMGVLSVEYTYDDSDSGYYEVQKAEFSDLTGATEEEDALITGSAKAGKGKRVEVE